MEIIMTTSEIIKALNKAVEMLPTASTVQLAILMTEAARQLEALDEVCGIYSKLLTTRIKV
jgi:hypothetical protein